MNNTIFYFFYSFAHQSVFVDKTIVFFAVWFPVVVIFFAGLFLLFHHDVFKAENPFQVFLQKKKEILKVFFTGCLAWFFSFFLKLLIHTSRPFDIFSGVHPLFIPKDFSFPSGHAMFFSALAFEIFLVHKKAGYFFIFFAILIGFARIISGVHLPVDIFGGLVLGFVIAYVINKYLKI